jgi:SAM-dependent methyltransferase
MRKYKLDSYGEDTLQVLFDSQVEFFRARSRNLAGMVSQVSRILEVGSFVGGFLIAAREQGWSATGVDIGLEACSFMRNMGLDVKRGEIDVVEEKRAFNAVFVWNTFDQLANPAKLLAKSKQVLVPGGLLVLRVPNGDFEKECLERREDEQLKEKVLTAQAYNNFLTFPYLNGYTRKSIEALLKSSGFSVEGCRGDVLVPLATPDTAEWAIQEERRSKRLTLRLCQREQVRTGSFLYPWMEIYARAA